MHNREDKYSIRKIKNTTASTRIKSKIIPALMSVFCLSSISSNVSIAQQGLGSLYPWMQGVPADAEHFVEFEFSFNDCYIVNKYPAGTFKFLKDKSVGQAVPVNVYTTDLVDEDYLIETFGKEEPGIKALDYAEKNGKVMLKPLNIVDTKDDKIFAKKLADGTELLQYTANSKQLKEYSSEPFSLLGMNRHFTVESETAEFYIRNIKNTGDLELKTLNDKETAPFKIVVEERGGENSLSEIGVPFLYKENSGLHSSLHKYIESDWTILKEKGLLDNKTVIYEYPLVDFSEVQEIRFADFSIPKGYELTKEEILSYMTTNIPNIDKLKINITEADEYRIEGEGMNSRTVRVDRDYLTFTDNNSYSKSETGTTSFIATYSDDLSGEVIIRNIYVEVVDGETKTVSKHYPTHNLKDTNRPCAIKPLSMDEGNEYIKVPNTYPTWELPSIEIPEIPNIPPNTTDNEGTPPLPPEPDPEPDEESTHPNTYPTWELPKAEVGVHPNTYPTTDKPERDIEIHPNTYPTHELPEAEVGVHPNTYPTIEKTEGNVGIYPNTYPTHELPEINLNFKVPNTYPTWEMPRIEFPTKPTPPPVIPEDKIEIPPKEKELPKTNTDITYMYTISSLLGLAILLKRKQKA